MSVTCIATLEELLLSLFISVFLCNVIPACTPIIVEPPKAHFPLVNILPYVVPPALNSNSPFPFILTTSADVVKSLNLKLFVRVATLLVPIVKSALPMLSPPPIATHAEPV